MKLTKEGRRSFITFLNLSKSELQNLKAADSNGNIIKLEDWEVSEVINLSSCIRDIQAQKCTNFRIQELNKDDFKDFKIRKGVTTLRPSISSFLLNEAAPTHEESTLKSYLRCTLQPGSKMNNRTIEVKSENKDKLDNVMFTKTSKNKLCKNKKVTKTSKPSISTHKDPLHNLVPLNTSH